MSPEDFLKIADLMPDGAILLTKSGRVIAANRQTTKLGLAAEQIRGKELVHFVEGQAEFKNFLRLCARTREPVIGALTFRSDEGTAVACRCYGALVEADASPDKSQILLRFTQRENTASQFEILTQKIGALNDEILRRRKLENQLRNQSDLFQITLASIGDAVVTVDAEGRVTFLNSIAEGLTGWDSRDAAGLPLEDVFHIVNEFTRERADNPVEKVLRLGTIVGLANHTVLVARDGRERPIDDSAAPIRDVQGNIIGVVLVFRDVTERRNAQHSLVQRAEALAEADRRKNEFLAMLAHELRNPLAPIRSGLDLLSLEVGETETIQLMRDQVKHVVHLVDDLLDVSRIATGRIQLRKETVELAPIVTRGIKSVQHFIDVSQHELHVDLPDEPIYVHADPVRLSQVVTNLLSNAAKYTEPRGRIEVALTATSQGVALRVRDSGVGIEPELLPHVFDVFVQAERSIDRSQGGLGLGLTLVRKLVEMHDGTVEASSPGANCGSEFTVNLPVIGVGVIEAPQPKREIHSTSRRILVVDDNVGAAKMLRLLLSHCGAGEVTMAYDGPAALEAALTHRPEIILLDIGLPHMDGYEVARRLRSDPAFDRTLLVAVTGYGQQDDIRSSKEAGFDEHLVKPPSVESLLALFVHPKLI